MIKAIARLFAAIVLASCVTSANSDPVDVETAGKSTNLVTPATLAKFSPRARPEITNEIIKNWKKTEGADITTALRVQHFFSEIAVETGGLTRLDENLNYTAAGLLRVWPKRFTPELAQRYAHAPEALANYVYNGRNGNQKDTDDGWRYRGGGLIQLTGRGNYRDRGEQLGLGASLETNPDTVRRPELAFLTAYSYWKVCGANTFADQDDVRGVRKTVNGGLIGIADAQLWLVQAKKAFRAPTTELADEATLDNQQKIATLHALQQLGYVGVEVTAGADMQPSIETGLKKFQSEVGLPQTGVLDEDTLYAITDPRNLVRD